MSKYSIKAWRQGDNHYCAWRNSGFCSPGAPVFVSVSPPRNSIYNMRSGLQNPVYRTLCEKHGKAFAERHRLALPETSLQPTSATRGDG